MIKENRLIKRYMALGLVALAIGIVGCSSAPSSTSSQVPVKTLAPRSVSTSTPTPTPTHTVYVTQPPAQSAPVTTDPWAVLSEYYGNIDSHDYVAAWALLAPNMQAQLGPYDTWMNGYATSGSQDLVEMGESGDQVTAQLSALQSDGNTKIYYGTWTVVDGLITSASVQETA